MFHDKSWLFIRPFQVFLFILLGWILAPWSAVNVFLLVNSSSHRDLAALRPDDIRQSSEPIFITAAPQDKHVFLTWSKYDESSIYVIYWRPVTVWTPFDSDEWNEILVKDQEHYAVENLTNGVEYKFYISLLWQRDIRSPVIKQTPRVRDNCPPHISCTQVDADQWLRLNGIDPLSLICHGAPIKEWNINSPNCYYYTDDFASIILLSRSIDSVFSPPPDRSLREIRQKLIQTLWPTRNPFLHPEDFPAFWTPIDPPVAGNVTGFSSVVSYRIEYNQQLASRISIFQPLSEITGYAIYHEGHDPRSGVDIGADSINWLLSKGMYVVNIDMPLYGLNTVDISPGFSLHKDFVRFNHWVENPISLFLLPVKAVVDMIDRTRKDNNSGKNILMMGRSGGGWTTTLYGALDPRIYVSNSIVGQMPISLRSEPNDVGDYEQNDPFLFDIITYEDLMKLTGRKGALFVYNTNDPCCFRIQEDSPIVEYLNEAAEELEKNISVWIDKNNLEHSISQEGLEVLDRFLQDIEFW